MSINALPREIIYFWVDNNTSIVCQRWYTIWYTKPMSIKPYCVYGFYHFGTYCSLNVFSKFKNLIELYMFKDTVIDPSIESLVTLRSLESYGNKFITNKMLICLTNLTSLELNYNRTIICETFNQNDRFMSLR